MAREALRPLFYLYIFLQVACQIEYSSTFTSIISTPTTSLSTPTTVPTPATTTPPIQIGTCFTNFILLGNRCYLFSQQILLANTWEDARAFCKTYSTSGLNYDLLVIGSTGPEFELIREQMINRGYTNATIGASAYTLGINAWFWIDGAQIDMNNPFWDCGAPNSGFTDAVGMLTFTSEALATETVRRLRVRDVDKNLKSYYICEGDPAF